MEKLLVGVMLVALTVGVAGCSSKAGNVALGAGVAGGAYEYSNKRAIEDLDRDLKDGKISKDEYDRRRREIESRSAVY